MQIESLLIKLIFETRNDLEGEARRYSGRNMMGKDCIGMSTPVTNVATLITTLMYRAAILLKEDLMDKYDMNQLMDAMCNVKWESLGHHLVLYWPTIKTTPEEFARYDEQGNIIEDEEPPAHGYVEQ